MQCISSGLLHLIQLLLLPGNRNFLLYTLINKSAVNDCVRVKSFPWVSTHSTSIPLEWLHCRFLMLLFAGGGL